MLAVRTPGAPQTACESAACDSAFPLERQGRLLRSRSISGLYSRSLHSGLQPPCLRFATAVTGRHARLGSRLLARLCRGRHLRRQTSTRLQGATLIEPDVPISGIRLSDWLHRKAHSGAGRGRRSRAQHAAFSVDHVEGEPSVAAPCHLVPSGEEVAHALIDVVVDRRGRPADASRRRSSSTSRAETCSACRALPAMDRCCRAPADRAPSS